jgi:hypothetical protein
MGTSSPGSSDESSPAAAVGRSPVLTDARKRDFALQVHRYTGKGVAISAGTGKGTRRYRRRFRGGGMSTGTHREVPVQVQAQGPGQIYM